VVAGRIRNAEVEHVADIHQRAVDHVARDVFRNLGGRHAADGNAAHRLHDRALNRAAGTQLLAGNVVDRGEFLLAVQIIGTDLGDADELELVEAGEQALFVQRIGGQAGLARVFKHEGQLEHFQLGEAAGRVGRDNLGDVDDAVLDQLELGGRARAKRAAGIVLDLQRALGRLFDGLDKGRDRNRVGLRAGREGAGEFQHHGRLGQGRLHERAA
jgi:hypothetical protein